MEKAKTLNKFIQNNFSPTTSFTTRLWMAINKAKTIGIDIETEYSYCLEHDAPKTRIGNTQCNSCFHRDYYHKSKLA